MKGFAWFMAFYFSLGSLLPRADFSQLGKIPSVIRHYQLHQQIAHDQGKAFSWLTFVAEHFVHTDSHEHDDGEHSHQKLPLKHLTAFDYIILPQSGLFPLEAALYVAKLAPNHSSWHPAAYADSIFRPPIQARTTL